MFHKCEILDNTDDVDNYKCTLLCCGQYLKPMM